VHFGDDETATEVKASWGYPDTTYRTEMKYVSGRNSTTVAQFGAPLIKLGP
jgi:hypothetical protein